AEKVYIVYRRDSLRAEDVNVRSVQNNPKVEIIYNAYPTEIKGQNKVEKLVLDNKRELDVDGVFVAIGREPLTGMLDHLEVEYSDKGEIIVDKYKMTKTPGLFAAGDIIPGVKQALTASAYGVEAVFGIREFNKRKSA
ncbi:MAG: NAD(P)/FAD-dependent oxidoreductase, partial [Patescibacteria group bacterium]|nr:NAD(P)/FAD-dependent oxidoreductase [Patescibacteria group bacterium]